jgi:hypothetical protein
MTETAPATPPSVVERDPRPALVVAAVVAVVLVIEMLVSFIESFAFGGGDNRYLLGVFVPQMLAGALPKAVGIFLVLWLWPARSDDRVLMVLVKALVAAAVGCVFAVLIGLAYSLIVFGLRFSDAGALPYNPFSGILSSVVALAPLVMLVVLAQSVIRRGARL